ncbi:MAG: thermonuclease family protein [Chloroflexota bacterium]
MLDRRTFLVAIIGLLILLVVLERTGLSNLGDGDEPTDGDGQTEAEVVRVVDGDTIIVRLDGDEERLRYIGIDAPESSIPDQAPECFGPEAARANEELVGGETVLLEADVSNRDQFGRLLRYVYVDDGDDRFMVNQELVESGYAEAVRYPPDTAYADDLERAEEIARANRAGIWSACR